MNYLLDTCVISELVKPNPEKAVFEWIALQEEARIYLSVITYGELRKGIARLSESGKRNRLQRWLDVDLKQRFEGRWLEVSLDVCDYWGLIAARQENAGQTLPVLDGLIAATALVHGMVVVTRNVRHMQSAGAEVNNPWPPVH